MPSVDKRIVEMQFDNAQFERGIKDTQKSLQDLNQGLHLDGVSTALDNISSKFSAFGAIAFTVLQEMTSSAIDFGKRAVSAVIDPLIEGGKKRALNIEQAQFQFKGLGMNAEKAMADALYAVQGTAFGLDEAAKAAAQFGASGVKLGKDMKASLRGVSGLAAMTGGSYDDVANIFVKVAGQGRLMGDDLNRIGARGINAAATLRDYFQKTGKTAIKTEADVRSLVSDGGVDFQTFAKAMDSAFGKNATKANDLYTGALSNMHAALSRIGASFEALKLERNRKIFNAMSPVIDKFAEALGPVVKLYDELMKSSGKAVVGFLNGLDPTKLTGSFKALTDIIRSVISIVKSIAQTFALAWREIFPDPFEAKTLQTFLGKVATWLGKVAKAFKDGVNGSSNLFRIFRGFASTVEIVGKVTGGLFGVLKNLFSSIDDGNFSIMGLIASIADAITNFNFWLSDGQRLNIFFDHLSDVIGFVVDGLALLKNAIVGIFSGWSKPDAKAVTDSLGTMKDHLGGVVDFSKKAAKVLSDFGKKIKTALQPVIDVVTESFSALWDAVKESFSTGNFDAVLSAFNTGFLGMIALAIKKFLSGGMKFDFGGGFLESLKGPLEGLTGALSAMQTEIKANALIKIATAVGILTAAMIALSFVDDDKMANALAGMAAGFGELLGTMSVINKLSAAAGMVKMPVMAASMIALASAMLLMATAVRVFAKLDMNAMTVGLMGVAGSLSAIALGMKLMPPNIAMQSASLILIAGALNLIYLAVKNFGSLDWTEIGKGLTGVSGALVGIGVAMQATPKGILLQSAALIAISGAVNLLYLAVKNFGSLDWMTIGKGLSGVAGGLSAIALAMHLMPKGMVLQGAALIEISAALNVLYLAVSSFSNLDWMSMARGLTAMTGALVGIAVAMQAMPKGMLLQSVALNAVATSLLVIGKVLKSMGGISWDEMAHGLTALAGSLGILAGGLQLMKGTLAASASLTAASVGITALAGALSVLGHLSIGTLITGLAAVAVSLGLLIAAGMLATPVTPAILALAAAMAALGVAALGLGVGIGAVMAGIGVLLGGLAALGTVGAAGVTTLLLALDGFIKRLPDIAIGVANALTAMIVSLGKNAPKIVNAFVKIVNSLLDAVVKILPKLEKAVTKIIAMILRVLTKAVPDIAKAGLKILISLLDAINNNLPKVTKQVVKLITTLLNGISNNLGKIIKAGLNILVSLLNGIANNIGRVTTAAGNVITKFIGGLGNLARKVITAGTKLITNIITGIGDGASNIAKAAVTTATKFLSSLAKQTVRFVDQGFIIVINLINGIADSIRSHSGDLWDAGWNLVKAIIDGALQGVKNLGGMLASKLKNMVSSAWGGIKSFLGINSPSKKFIWLSEMMVQGAVKGLDQNQKDFHDSMHDLGDDAVTTMHDSMSKIPDVLDGLMDYDPTITPVLDLTKVTQGAQEMNDMMNVTPITAAASYAQASNLSALTAANRQAVAQTADPNSTTGQTIFQQYNNSPKSLSAIEIYRNTKNLLNLANSGSKIA